MFIYYGKATNISTKCFHIQVIDMLDTVYLRTYICGYIKRKETYFIFDL